MLTVKELLSHKGTAMTMRYAQLTQEHKRQAVELLDRQHMDSKPEQPLPG